MGPNRAALSLFDAFPPILRCASCLEVQPLSLSLSLFSMAGDCKPGPVGKLIFRLSYHRLSIDKETMTAVINFKAVES